MHRAGRTGRSSRSISLQRLPKRQDPLWKRVPVHHWLPGKRCGVDAHLCPNMAMFCSIHSPDLPYHARKRSSSACCPSNTIRRSRRRSRKSRRVPTSPSLPCTTSRHHASASTNPRSAGRDPRTVTWRWQLCLAFLSADLLVPTGMWEEEEEEGEKVEAEK